MTTIEDVLGRIRESSETEKVHVVGKYYFPLYAALGIRGGGRSGGSDRDGLSDSISSPVRTPCSDRRAALATTLVHPQIPGLLERISWQLLQ